MVVNIYGSKKVKINNPMSQVDVPLAKSQTSFLGLRKDEAGSPLESHFLHRGIDLHRGKMDHFI